VRIDEFASAEEQIALFKLVTDKVWQSLADQARAQAEQRAQKQRAAATRGPGRAKRGGAKPTPIKPVKPLKPVPEEPPPKPPPIQTNQQQPQAPKFPNNKTPNNKITPQNADLAEPPVRASPLQRQQTALLPMRPG